MYFINKNKLDVQLNQKKAYNSNPMITYSLQDISESNDRHKIFLISCLPENTETYVRQLHSQKVASINVGYEVANFISQLNDYAYLNIDVYDFIVKLFDARKAKSDHRGNDILCIYNFGILMEPALLINTVQLLKDCSKTTAIIILWEHIFEIPNRLLWTSQQSKVNLDFSETPLKQIQYAI